MVTELNEIHVEMRVSLLTRGLEHSTRNLPRCYTIICCDQQSVYSVRLTREWLAGRPGRTDRWVSRVYMYRGQPAKTDLRYGSQRCIAQGACR
jgi:hypothetical protein